MAVLPRINRVLPASSPAPAPAPEQPAPEDSQSLSGAVLDAGKFIGTKTLSGLGMLGNLLDLPGSMVRDVLVADNPFDQLLDPLSHQDTGASASGRDVLSRNLLTSWLFSPNKETGMSGWMDDPLEGVQDVAGFAAELALDPLSWITAGVAKIPGAAAKVGKATKWAKLERGLNVLNELDPGTHVGRSLGVPQALAKRSDRIARRAAVTKAASEAGQEIDSITEAAKTATSAASEPTTLADKAFETLDTYSQKAASALKSTATSAYDAAPAPVKSTADFIQTEGGKKIDAFMRWTLSAFDRRVDDRISETGQAGARIKSQIEDDLLRKFSEPLVQTFSDEAHYGPDGLSPVKAQLADGQTIEDWHTEFSESLMHAIETDDVSALEKLLPFTGKSDVAGEFFNINDLPPIPDGHVRLVHLGSATPDGVSKTGFRYKGDIMSNTFAHSDNATIAWPSDSRFRDSDMLVMDVPDNIHRIHRNTVTASGMLEGKYVVGRVVNPLRAPKGPFVASYHRLKAAGRELLHEQRAAGIITGDLNDVINHMYRQMNPRLAEWRQRRELADASSGSGTVTREDLFRGFYNGTGSRVESGVNRITSDPEIISALQEIAASADPSTITMNKIGKAAAKVIEEKYAGDVDPRLPVTSKSGKVKFRDPKQDIPATPATDTTPEIPGQKGKLQKMDPSEFKRNYVRVPDRAEREFSIAAGDAFDLPAGDPFNMANPLHRETIFKTKSPLVFRKTAASIADPNTKHLPEIIHQEFEDRWEKLGHYLWGSDDPTKIQLMRDHTDAIASNGGVFGHHVLLNKQRYNQQAAQKIATARHFTDIFEAGLKNGEIRNPDALTPQAASRIEVQNLQKSEGVPLKDVFDAYKDVFDRDRIYANSFERLSKADPTFDSFMKEVDVPEGMDVEDFLDDAGNALKELDVDALRTYMDNLVLDKQLANELRELHKAYNNPEPSWESFSKLANTLGAQWKAGVLTAPATQARNYTSGITANMYSDIWSATAQSAAHDVVFDRANEFLAELPDVAAYIAKRKFDPTDPYSATRAVREMYAIEKGHLASMARDFTGQANTADTMTDFDHLLGLLPGNKGIRSGKELAKSTFNTLRGKNPDASWKNPFEIAGTTRFFGKNAGTIRRESKFAPVTAINTIGKTADDANRIAGWLEGMRRGKSSRDAFKRADEVQLNYDPSSFTDFERKLKTIFPFYSFFSRETAYFAKELMTNPAGKLGKLIRLMNHSQTNEYLPEHIREGGAIPWGSRGEDGTDRYLTGLGMMFEDVPKTLVPNSAAELGRDLLSKTNPMIKAPIEYTLGRSSFQGGPMGGRDIADMDPLLGRIFTQLGIQESKPNQNAKPAFGSPLLEHALANSPLSRVLSTTKTLLEPSERKSILDKALITLSGMRITSVSPEQRDRGIRELTNAIAKEHGARAFTTLPITPELLEETKGSPEVHAELQWAKQERERMDAARKIKRRKQDGPTKTEIRQSLSQYLKANGMKMSRAEQKERVDRVSETKLEQDTKEFWSLLLQ